MAPYLDVEMTTPNAIAPTFNLDVSAKQKYNDWRDEFFTKGYAVLKGVVPTDRAEHYRQKMHAWLGSFDNGFDINDKSTWIEENLPKSFKNGMYLWHCAAHEKYVWDARQEQGVIDAFTKIWETDELIVSYDTINLTLPNAASMGGVKPWPHGDQAPERQGLSCVQGIINLSPAGPKDGGLVVMENSAPLFEKFFALHPPDRSKGPLAALHYDFYPFEEKDVKCRTMHYAVYPETDQIRSIIYACYTPRALASAEDLQSKKEIFERWEATTHWPHINIFSQGKCKIDGKLDPWERQEPLEKPELTDKLLRLAGVKPYPG